MLISVSPILRDPLSPRGLTASGMGLGTQGLAAGGETGHGHETGMNFKQIDLQILPHRGRVLALLGQGRHARLLWGNRVEAFMPKGFGIIKKAPEHRAE